MRVTRCPKCGAKASPTDTVCMDCGADLTQVTAVDKEKLRAQSVAARAGWTEVPPSGAGGAAAGRAVPGETSEETRLRVFDKQAAKGLAQEAITSYIIGAVALLAGILVLALGFGRYKLAGSLAGLDMSVLRSFGGFADNRVLALILGGTGLAGIAIGIGVLWRGIGAMRAVKEVRAGEKPTIVALNPFLQIGLLLLAIFCPPLGLIVGILLKFSDDSDIRGFAQLIIYAALLVIAILVGNMLWGLAENFKATHVAPGNST